VAYDWYIGLFDITPPRYPFLVWIWSGMAFLWGVMFWDISTNVLAKRVMIPYTYLEKAITSTSVLVAWLTGNVPGSFFLGVVFTDVIWVPIFVALHVRVSRIVRSGSS
jgi:hypothetical protein